jgi:hypothetical protein
LYTSMVVPILTFTHACIGLYSICAFIVFANALYEAWLAIPYSMCEHMSVPIQSFTYACMDLYYIRASMVFAHAFYCSMVISFSVCEILSLLFYVYKHDRPHSSFYTCMHWSSSFCVCQLGVSHSIYSAGCVVLAIPARLFLVESMQAWMPQAIHASMVYFPCKHGVSHSICSQFRARGFFEET